MDSQAQNQAEEMSPLELLPVALFLKIAKYLLVVDYDNDCHSRPRSFICRVKLNRGYALAVCSRRCHALFEESAKVFLDFYTPANYFLPNVPLLEAPSSYLAQFYSIKGMEATFRNESHCLREMLSSSTDMQKIEQNTHFATQLLLHVQRVLDGPLVRNWADVVLDDCIRACSKILHWTGTRPILLMRPDPVLAADAVPVLERIVSLVHLKEHLGFNLRRHKRIMPYWLIYLATTRSQPPNLQKAEESLMSLLDEFSSPILSNSMSTILSNHHLRACQELLELYIEQKRIDDAVCLLRRSREATKSLDPVHIWTLTKLVKHYCRVLGLDRATMFVSETMDEMNSVLSPESELQWNRNSYNPSKWLRYKQDCATWLRQLQHRAN